MPVPLPLRASQYVPGVLDYTVGPGRGQEGEGAEAGCWALRGADCGLLKADDLQGPWAMNGCASCRPSSMRAGVGDRLRVGQRLQKEACSPGLAVAS